MSTSGQPLRQNPVWYYPIWTMVGAINLLVFRFRATGVKGIPREGPLLLLPNHTATFDPFWAGWFMLRPAWYMASQQIFRVPVLGRLLATLGAFPKVKFVKDRGSMARLQELYEADQIVTVFPEGERSWDGRTTPVLPGIGRLIKRLDARVVVCRIQTGHLIFPRWADYPRWVPLQMDYSEALTWPAEATPEEITADIDQRIRIDPEPEIRGLSFGWRMAWGLPTYLWACPVCFEPNALQVLPDDGNAVRCAACGSGWTLDTTNRMHPRDGAPPALSVFSAYDRIRDHFGSPPSIDPERFAREGVILDDEPVHIGRILKGGGTEPEPVGSGRLELRADGLRLYGDGPEPLWLLDLANIKAVSLEFGTKMQVRTAEAVFQIDPAITSRIQWADFLRPWWSAARER